MFNRDDKEVAASSAFRLWAIDVLGGDGVETGADDWAVVRDEVEGTRKFALPGRDEKLAKDPSDNSCCELDRSVWAVNAADIS